jgi:hypothetical protein
MTELENSPTEELIKSEVKEKPSPWYADSTRISLLAFILSLATLIVTSAASTAVYFISRADDREKRSVTEISLIYDKDFASSLSKIPGQAYTFIETDKTNKLRSKPRFEKFWYDFNSDADMLLVSSRLKAVAQCAEVGDCDREELFSRFPEEVYQAIFFLREFVFLNDDLETYANKGDLEGWWLGDSERKFLADYCGWASKKFGGMNLWSEKHERLRSPGQALPDPCLPRALPY